MNAICVKYRLYPTSAQETALNKMLEMCRQVYNSLVNERKALYEIKGNAPTLRQQQLSLTQWKKAHPELTAVHSQVLQNVAVRVDLAFQAFFRRLKAGDKPGFPRLKGQGSYDSITFPQAPSGCKLAGNFLELSKIGQIKTIIHRSLLGTPKTCTIRKLAGKWFACFACEYTPAPLFHSTQSIGIDVGLEKFAALSDGSFVENPRFFRKDEKALAKASRKQAKAKRGSPLRRKANRILSRIHERIRNRRHNFVHQLTRKIVNQFGMIAVEKLNVKGMVKNHCLAKSISDASWSQFRTVLSLKAASAARKVVEVNPAYTSQMCSRCGNIAKKLLKERWHFCPICSLSLDRDTNAAFNILQTAVSATTALCLSASTARETALGLQSVAGMPCIEAAEFIRAE